MPACRGLSWRGSVMNQRALVTLGVLFGVAYGQSPTTLPSRVHERLRAMQAKDPADTALKVVTLGAAAFYAVERGQNPRVGSYFDALVYVSSCLSAETCHIEAETPLGKALGSALRTYGPSIASRALSPPASSGERSATDGSLRQVTEKLDQILCELVRQGESAATS